MPTIVETGSDIASLCLYDPSAVPFQKGKSSHKQRESAVAQLAETNRAMVVRTGGDGTFIAHVFIDESFPEKIEKKCRKPISSTHLTNRAPYIILSGTENVGEESYAQGNSTHTPEKIPLAPGEYKLTIWQLNWPESVIGKETKRRALSEFGEQAWEQYHRRSVLGTILVCILMLSGVFCLFATLTKTGRAHLGWQGLSVLWLSWIAAMQIIPRLMTRSDSARFAQFSQVIEKEFPHYVIQLIRQ